jgi:hypothetical protein
MDQVIAKAADSIFAYGILGLGWLLYLVERYYVSPKKDEQARKDLESVSGDYKALTEQFNTTLTQFTVVLEQVRENLRRMP